MSFRYINRNPFPIYLPCERGGQVMFDTNQSTTRQWFSRFVGAGQLTRESIPDTPASTIPVNPGVLPKQGFLPPPTNAQMAKASAAPLPPPQEVIMKPRTSSFIDEETPEYRLHSGIYNCKICDVFRTGSSDSMRQHLSDYHSLSRTGPSKQMPQIEEQVVLTSKGSPKPPPTDEDSPQVSSLPREAPKPPTQPHTPIVAEPTPIKTEAKELPKTTESGPIRRKSAPVAEEAPAPVEDKKVFTCPHGSCGKQFLTEKGLKMHILRVH